MNRADSVADCAAPHRVDEIAAALREGPAADPDLARQLAAAIEQWRRPPRLQLAGRSRAGKTTLRRALALAPESETPAVDEPGNPDPDPNVDILLYVLAGTLEPADCRVLAQMPAGRSVVVLNKADAIGTSARDAWQAARRYGSQLGLPVFPVVGVLAAWARSGVVRDQDLAVMQRCRTAGPALTATPEAFTAAAVGPDAAERRDLVERWGLFGVECAVVALREQSDLDAAQLRQVLYAASGIDAVAQRLGSVNRQVLALRGGSLVDAVARLARGATSGNAVARTLLLDYCDSDEACGLSLDAGLAHPDLAHLAAGYGPARPPDAQEARRRASRWRAVVSSDLSPGARRAALRVHNGCMRWAERMSRAQR